LSGGFRTPVCRAPLAPLARTDFRGPPRPRSENRSADRSLKKPASSSARASQGAGRRPIGHFGAGAGGLTVDPLDAVGPLGAAGPLDAEGPLDAAAGVIFN